MTSDDVEKQRVEGWRAEATALLTAERAALATGSQVLGFGVTVVGAASAYGIAQGHPELLWGFPTALALLCAYALQVFGDVAAMGAARRVIERNVNCTLGASVLIYDTVVAPTRAWGGDESQRWIVFAYIVVLAVALVTCFAFTPAPGRHGVELKLIALLVGVVAYGTAFAALRAYRRVGGRVNDKIQEFAPDLTRGDTAAGDLAASKR